MKCPNHRAEAGFTLIEMMISLAMGLIIIVGLTSMFVTNSKVSETFTSRNERMSDLFLASQLMQAGLRESVSVLSPLFPADLQPGGRVCPGTQTKTARISRPASYPTSFPYFPYWDATSKTLTYQTMDGKTGIFQYQRPSRSCPHNGAGCIYWLRPDPCISKFQELMRNMDAAHGLVATTPPGGKGKVAVTLQSSYQTGNHQNAPLSLSFTLWPRN